MNTREILEENILNSLNECVDIITKHVDEDSQMDYIKRIESVAERVIKESEEYKYLKKLLDDAKKTCLRQHTVNVNKVFQSKVESEENNNSEITENHPFLKKIRQNYILSAIPQRTPSSQLIDPITKVPIIDPVRNKTCGHIYEKNSINEMLKKSKKMRCPYIGCVHSEEYFTYKDLEDVNLSDNDSSTEID